MRYAIVLAVLMLSGCITAEQRAEIALSRYGPFCDKLGFQRGTEPFATCVMQQANSDDARAMQAYGIYQQTRPRSCQAVGNTVTCY